PAQKTPPPCASHSTSTRSRPTARNRHPNRTGITTATTHIHHRASIVTAWTTHAAVTTARRTHHHTGTRSRSVCTGRGARSVGGRRSSSVTPRADRLAGRGPEGGRRRDG